MPNFVRMVAISILGFSLAACRSQEGATESPIESQTQFIATTPPTAIVIETMDQPIAIPTCEILGVTAGERHIIIYYARNGIDPAAFIYDGETQSFVDVYGVSYLPEGSIPESLETTEFYVFLENDEVNLISKGPEHPFLFTFRC